MSTLLGVLPGLLAERPRSHTSPIGKVSGESTASSAKGAAPVVNKRAATIAGNASGGAAGVHNNKGDDDSYSRVDAAGDREHRVSPTGSRINNGEANGRIGGSITGQPVATPQQQLGRKGTPESVAVAAPVNPYTAVRNGTRTNASEAKRNGSSSATPFPPSSVRGVSGVEGGQGLPESSVGGGASIDGRGRGASSPVGYPQQQHPQGDLGTGR